MIDKKQIMNTLGCDEEFITELLVKFVSESKSSMETLNAATENEEWVIVKGVAHKMISSAYIFNLNELVSIFKEIEILASEQKDLDRLYNYIEELNVEMIKLYEEIKRL